MEQSGSMTLFPKHLRRLSVIRRNKSLVVLRKTQDSLEYLRRANKLCSYVDNLHKRSRSEDKNCEGRFGSGSGETGPVFFQAVGAIPMENWRPPTLLAQVIEYLCRAEQLHAQGPNAIDGIKKRNNIQQRLKDACRRIVDLGVHPSTSSSPSSPSSANKTKARGDRSARHNGELTALHWVIENCPKFTRFLVDELKFDPNETVRPPLPPDTSDKDGVSHDGKEKDREKQQLDAEPFEEDNDALMYAILCYSSFAADFLISNSKRLKIDINRHNKQNDTPLVLACHLGLDNICELLIRHRAKVSLRAYEILQEADLGGGQNGDAIKSKIRAMLNAHRPSGLKVAPHYLCDSKKTTTTTGNYMPTSEEGKGEEERQKEREEEEEEEDTKAFRSSPRPPPFPPLDIRKLTTVHRAHISEMTEPERVAWVQAFLLAKKGRSVLVLRQHERHAVSTEFKIRYKDVEAAYRDAHRRSGLGPIKRGRRPKSWGIVTGWRDNNSSASNTSIVSPQQQQRQRKKQKLLPTMSHNLKLGDERPNDKEEDTDHQPHDHQLKGTSGKGGKEVMVVEEEEEEEEEDDEEENKVMEKRGKMIMKSEGKGGDSQQQLQQQRNRCQKRLEGASEREGDDDDGEGLHDKNDAAAIDDDGSEDDAAANSRKKNLEKDKKDNEERIGGTKEDDDDHKAVVENMEEEEEKQEGEAVSSSTIEPSSSLLSSTTTSEQRSNSSPPAATTCMSHESGKRWQRRVRKRIKDTRISREELTRRVPFDLEKMLADCWLVCAQCRPDTADDKKAVYKAIQFMAERVRERARTSPPAKDGDYWKVEEEGGGGEEDKSVEEEVGNDHDSGDDDTTVNDDSKPGIVETTVVIAQDNNSRNGSSNDAALNGRSSLEARVVNDGDNSENDDDGEELQELQREKEDVVGESSEAVCNGNHGDIKMILKTAKKHAARTTSSRFAKELDLKFGSSSRRLSETLLVTNHSQLCQKCVGKLTRKVEIMEKLRLWFHRVMDDSDGTEDDDNNDNKDALANEHGRSDDNSDDDATDTEDNSKNNNNWSQQSEDEVISKNGRGTKRKRKRHWGRGSKQKRKRDTVGSAISGAPVGHTERKQQRQQQSQPPLSLAKILDECDKETQIDAARRTLRKVMANLKKTIRHSAATAAAATVENKGEKEEEEEEIVEKDTPSSSSSSSSSTRIQQQQQVVLEAMKDMHRISEYFEDVRRRVEEGKKAWAFRKWAPLRHEDEEKEGGGGEIGESNKPQQPPASPQLLNKKRPRKIGEEDNERSERTRRFSPWINTLLKAFKPFITTMSSVPSLSPSLEPSLFFFEHLELEDLLLFIRRRDQQEEEERQRRNENESKTKLAPAAENKQPDDDSEQLLVQKEYLWKFFGYHPYGDEDEGEEARSHHLREEAQRSISSANAPLIRTTMPPPRAAATVARIALNAWAFTEIVKMYTAALERGLGNYDNVSEFLVHIHHVQALVGQLRGQSIPNFALTAFSPSSSQCNTSSLSSSSSSSSLSPPSSINSFIAEYKARWRKDLTLISKFEAARKNLLDAVPIAAAGGGRAVMFGGSPLASAPPHIMMATSGAQRAARCICSKLHVIDEMEHACKHNLQVVQREAERKENEQQQSKRRTAGGNHHGMAWEEIQSKLQQIENDAHRLELQFLA
eukprot:jgi/Bigna1/90006/estExt_fgenesh1_pg.C_600031